MADAKMPEAAPKPGVLQPAAKDEEKVIAPRVEGFKLFGTRTKDTAEIIESLSTLSFLEIAQEADYLALLNVENRDIRRNPYLFSTIYLRPDSIEVVYTLIPGMSPRRRRIDVLRHLLNVMTLMAGAYQIDDKYFYQTLQSSLAGIVEFASSDYKDIFAKYDSCLREKDDLKKRVDDLESSNTKISRELIESKAKMDELTLRLGQLESYSDDVLMVKIMDWLDVHRNEINLAEFSKQYSVAESRVEDILNKMIMQGYLELRG